MKVTELLHRKVSEDRTTVTPRTRQNMQSPEIMTLFKVRTLLKRLVRVN